MVLVDVVNTSPAKMSKFGRASGVTSPNFPVDRCGLLSSSPSREGVYPHAEEENEHCNGFNLGCSEDVNDELRTQCDRVKRLSLSSLHLPGLEDMSDTTSGWSSDGQSQLRPSQKVGCAGSNPIPGRVRAQGEGKPIDMPNVERGKSKKLKSRRKSGRTPNTMRESLLTEAWERKRDQMLQKPKREELVSSASNSGNLQDAWARTKSRNRSLTDDDFEELRGCIDLGFQFDENSSSDLCDTLPALEVYCAVKLLDSPRVVSPVSQNFPSRSRCSSPCASPTWKIASPGDDPEDVKGRLRHWAQAVACSARLCY